MIGATLSMYSAVRVRHETDDPLCPSPVRGDRAVRSDGVRAANQLPTGCVGRKRPGASAAIGGRAGVGVGLIFGNYLSAALRNPAAAQGQFGNLIFGFAVTEALGIFSLLIALLLLFAV